MPIPVAYRFPVGETTRRRLVESSLVPLWGGDEPPGWEGVNLRLFGGYNYGYMFPPGTLTKTGDSVVAVAKTMTVLSWSVTAFVIWGALTISIPQGLLFALMAFAYNEVLGYSGTEQSMEMTETGITFRQTRMISGVSMVYNMFAAYAPYMWWMGHPVGYLAAISSGTIIFNDLWCLFADLQKPKEQRVISHRAHFIGLAVGGWMAYFVNASLAIGVTMPVASPMLQFFAGAVWAYFNMAPAANAGLVDYFEPFTIANIVNKEKRRLRYERRARLPARLDYGRIQDVDR